MQEEEYDRKDYYAILGISRNASVEEIKQQYRTLSRQFHPDKQAPEIQEYANEYFHRIDRAYQVLSDEKKRKMYDLYGEKAVHIIENNTELVKKNDSLDPLDELVHTLYARELEVKSGQSGSFTMNVDVSNLIHPELASQSPMIPSFMMQPQPKPSKVHISSIQIVQNIQTRLSTSDVFSITGTATASEGRGMGVAVLGYQHTLSPDQLINLNLLFGSRNRVICEVIQSLTPDCQGVISLAYGNEGFGTDMKIVKQFTESFVGSLNVALEKGVTCSVDVDYQTNEQKMSGSMFVGEDLGVKLDYLRTLFPELGIRGKLQCKIGLSDILIETMVGKDLSPFSKVNLNVLTGLSGVSLKLKYQRGNMNFILPVLLSKNPFDWRSMGIGCLVTSLTSLCTYLYYNSSLGKKKKEEEEREKKKQEFLKEHGRLAALSQQEMMKGIAEKKKKEEEKKKGLVIRKACYGSAANIGIPEKVKNMEDAIDVTIPIQFMVKDSKVRLYAGSKQDYMGFWNPVAKDSSCRLYVRYSFNEKVYEIEVDGDEPLYLPTCRANCLGDEKDVE